MFTSFDRKEESVAITVRYSVSFPRLFRLHPRDGNASWTVSVIVIGEPRDGGGRFRSCVTSRSVAVFAARVADCVLRAAFFSSLLFSERASEQTVTPRDLLACLPARLDHYHLSFTLSLSLSSEARGDKTIATRGARPREASVPVFPEMRSLAAGRLIIIRDAREC